MQQVKWKVSGMDCNTCALHIHKYLEKQGMQQVKVNFANGDVWFVAAEKFAEEELKKGIANLGYEVVDEKSSEGIILINKNSDLIQSLIFKRSSRIN